MKRTLTLTLAVVAALTLPGCKKAAEPATTAAKKAEEAAEKAGEAAKASAEEAREQAVAAAEAAKKVAKVAGQEAARTAAVAAEGARRTAEAAQAGAAATAEAAKVAAADLKAAGALMDPSKATLTAPVTFRAKFATTKGDFTVLVTRALAPHGADRFYNLVKIGFYKDIAVFRVISGFMAQFGIHGDPAVSAVWREARIPDDPVKGSNTRGMLTFATAGPNTRTSQLFINFGDNKQLDGMGFAPFGQVEGEGMKVVDALFSGYGEGAPRGKGPLQGRVQREGNRYLKADFPEMDYIKEITIVE